MNCANARPLNGGPLFDIISSGIPISENNSSSFGKTCSLSVVITSNTTTKRVFLEEKVLTHKIITITQNDTDRNP